MISLGHNGTTSMPFLTNFIHSVQAVKLLSDHDDKEAIKVLPYKKIN
jgi:hypothetical protein